MRRRPKSHGQQWTKSDDSRLDALYKTGLPVRRIAPKLGRSPAAVYQRLSVRGKANRRGHGRIAKRESRQS